MQQVVSNAALRDRRGHLATLREHFAANLKRLLRERGLTQKSFAKAGSFDEGMVSRWVNRINFPEDKQIDRIAAVLSCSYEELVRDPTLPRSPLPVQIDAAIRELMKRAGYDIIKKN